MNEDLLSIGQFATACGLSVRSLRHYDEIGLLRPAHVDHWTGYRYYSLPQLRDAQTIRRLRELEVPLDEIPPLLIVDDGLLEAQLRAHRGRIAAAAAASTRILASLDTLIEGREELVPATGFEIEVEQIEELRLAAVMRQLHDDEVNTGIPHMIDAVSNWLAERGAEPSGAPLAVFRSGDAPGWHLVEAGWPVPPGVEGDGAVNIHVYPASVVHGSSGRYTASLPAGAARGLREMQRLQAEAALSWVARALGLPSPS